MKNPQKRDPRILIINPFGIGDVIFSTPLIRAMKENCPGSFIGYICNKRAREILRSNPCIDRIYVYEKDEFRAAWQDSKIRCVKMLLDFLKNIQQQKFDIAIDLSLGYQYSLLSKIIGIKRRIGFNYRNRGRFLTQRITIDGFHEKHVIEYYRDMLELLGMDPKNYCRSPKVHLNDEDAGWAADFLSSNGVVSEDLLIGVIPGCGASWGADASHRRWDRKKFADVCDTLFERHGAKVILLGNSSEAGICNEIQGMLKHKAIMSCGKTNLRNFLGVINRCRLVVTNDGGPLHMAVGLGVKSVSIFGPVDEKIYCPYPPSQSHIVVSRPGMECRPCYKKFKHNVCKERPCLEDIGPEDVLKAVDCLLANDAGKA